VEGIQPTGRILFARAEQNLTIDPTRGREGHISARIGQFDNIQGRDNNVVQPSLISESLKNKRKKQFQHPLAEWILWSTTSYTAKSVTGVPMTTILLPDYNISYQRLPDYNRAKQRLPAYGRAKLRMPKLDRGDPRIPNYPPRREL
jgi:hypothetical protein